MATFQGQIDEQGELMVLVDGSYLTLRQFLEATELAPKRRQRPSGRRQQRRSEPETLALAK